MRGALMAVLQDVELLLNADGRPAVYYLMAGGQLRRDAHEVGYSENFCIPRSSAKAQYGPGAGPDGGGGHAAPHGGRRAHGGCGCRVARGAGELRG